MLLRKTASLLSALALGPRKPTDKILRLCRRSVFLGGLWDLRPRCAHDSCHSSLAADEQKSATCNALPLCSSLGNGPSSALTRPQCWQDNGTIVAVKPRGAFVPYFQAATQSHQSRSGSSGVQSGSDGGWTLSCHRTWIAGFSRGIACLARSVRGVFVGLLGVAQTGSGSSAPLTAASGAHGAATSQQTSSRKPRLRD
jgi:hypothetical protein